MSNCTVKQKEYFDVYVLMFNQLGNCIYTAIQSFAYRGFGNFFLSMNRETYEEYKKQRFLPLELKRVFIVDRMTTGQARLHYSPIQLQIDFNNHLFYPSISSSYSINKMV